MTDEGSEFEMPGSAVASSWKVEFSASPSDHTSAFWTGRAKDAKRATEVGRMVLDATWNTATGSRDGMPESVAGHAKASNYSANDFAKRASRSIGDGFWNALEGASNPKPISFETANAIAAAVCASDGEIHKVTLLKGVGVVAGWNSMNGRIDRKYAQILVTTIRGIQIPVKTGRATDVALFALAEMAGDRKVAGFGSAAQNHVSYAPNIPESSATLRAAFALSARRALQSARPAIDFFGERGRADLAHAIEAQARQLEAGEP